MKKILSLILVIAMIASVGLVSSFAAGNVEVDLSKLPEAKTDFAAHGYEGVSAFLIGYSEVYSLGTLNLADYDKMEISYATDKNFQNFYEGMSHNAVLGIKSARSSYGQVETPFNDEDSLAWGELEAAYETNPDGSNWDKNERVCTLDLSDVDYNGEVFLTSFSSTGNQILVVKVKLIAEASTEDPSNPGDTTNPDNQNPGTADSTAVVFMIAAAAVVVTLLLKKRAF